MTLYLANLAMLVLTHFLWQGVAIAAAAGLAGMLLSRTSARAR